ncbi:hypothetical protein CDD83_3208 [Cordyceps sp. RAO-2017]|nr:hypothetical protein CDD83_3208 [Cordyceps sp. RAO-2017]
MRMSRIRARDEVDSSSDQLDRENSGIWEHTSSIQASCNPVVHRRTSLTNAFQTVKARYSREKFSDTDEKTDSGRSTKPLRSSGMARQLLTSPGHTEPAAERPPQLDVLSELPWDGLYRSSTFRACLKKAVDDINQKYITSASVCKSRDRIYHSSDNDDTAIGLGQASYHGPTDFQPRYRRPRFVHAPMIYTEPTTSELKQIGPLSSRGNRRLRRSGNGGLSSTDHEGVHRSTVPYAHSHASSRSKLPSTPSSVHPELNDSGESEDASSNWRDGKNRLQDGAVDLDTTTQGTPPVTTDAVTTDASSGILSQDLENESCGSCTRDCKANLTPVQALPKTALGPSEVDASSSAMVIPLMRVRNSPRSPVESTEAKPAPLSRPPAQGVNGFAVNSELRTPSVSELVLRFRRMELPPNIPAARKPDLPEASSRIGASGTNRGHLSDMSEDASALSSKSDNV